MPTYDTVVEGLTQPDSLENSLMNELASEHSLSIENDFEELIRLVQSRLEIGEDDYDDSMDGDHASAFASIGWGTDEDYNPGEMI